ncbi:MAG TPA: O-antigen ligase family protein [Jatrophihabitans sp.]|nr:O-antigen ligase family protein [Jatrophihabitans sp.]
MVHVDDRTTEPPAAGVDRPTVAATLLLAGLAAATCAHGGYERSGRLLLLVALAAAGFVIPLSVRSIAARSMLPVGALLGWLLLDSAWHGGFAGGLPAVQLVLGTLVTLGCARALTPGTARLLLTGLLWLGTAVALLGWAGVAGRRSPAAITGQGLFRAASTFSYPNATGAFLAVAALLGAGLLAGHGRTRGTGALVAIVLTGLAATLSRGAVLALLGGLLVMLATLGARRTLGLLGYPLLGGCLGAAALLPSAPAAAQPHFSLALLGLLAGAAVGALPVGRGRAAALPYLPLLAGVVAVAALHPFPAVGQARLNATSDDRWGALHAVGEVIARQPLTGAGPRLTVLSWHPAAGGVQVFRYAHDEYLQVVAEFGLIGLVLLLGCLVTLGRWLRGHWPPRSADRALPATALAVLVALLVSVSLDFTGHFPALVLTAAAVVGCAAPGLPGVVIEKGTGPGRAGRVASSVAPESPGAVAPISAGSARSA